MNKDYLLSKTRSFVFGLSDDPLLSFRVEWRGESYGVYWATGCLSNKTLTYSSEGLSSSRTDEFLADHRFIGLKEAIHAGIKSFSLMMDTKSRNIHLLMTPVEDLIELFEELNTSCRELYLPETPYTKEVVITTKTAFLTDYLEKIKKRKEQEEK